MKGVHHLTNTPFNQALMSVDSICFVPIYTECLESIPIPIDTHRERETLFIRIVKSDGTWLTVSDLDRMCLAKSDIGLLLDVCARRVHLLGSQYFPEDTPGKIVFERAACFIDHVGNLQLTFFLSVTRSRVSRMH